MKVLGKSTFIKSLYDTSPNRIDHYGCLTLVRKTWKATFSEVKFKSGMDRSLILAKMPTFGRSSLQSCHLLRLACPPPPPHPPTHPHTLTHTLLSYPPLSLAFRVAVIGNVHLESLHFAATRKEQLRICEKVMRNYANALVVGDFNFDATKAWGEWNIGAPQKTEPSRLENRVLEEVLPNWIDAWPAVKGFNDMGYTFDGATNPTCVRDKGEQMRYDRIMVKGTCEFACSSIEMLGQKAINESGLKPSDHYGLFMKLKRVDESKKL